MTAQGASPRSLDHRDGKPRKAAPNPAPGRLSQLVERRAEALEAPGRELERERVVPADEGERASEQQLPLAEPGFVNDVVEVLG